MIDKGDNDGNGCFRDLDTYRCRAGFGIVGIMRDVSEKLVDGDVDLHLRFHRAVDLL